METTITFLFKEGNWMFDLRLNYRMGLKLIETCAIRMTDKARVLAMTLNKSKKNLKWMT